MTTEERARKAIMEGRIPSGLIDDLALQTGQSRRWVVRTLYNGLEAYLPDTLILEEPHAHLCDNEGTEPGEG